MNVDLATLEKAAETILSPTAAQNDRQCAEAILQQLKSANLRAVLDILENSPNHFVLFMVSQALGEVVLKQWVLLDAVEIEGLNRKILQFVAENEALPNWVTASFMRSIAMILKRATFDEKAGDMDQLYQLIRNMLMSTESARLQSVGCQLISAITEQYSNSWHNSQFAITWDFHSSAKLTFERTGLRKLLEMSLTTLGALSNEENILSDPFKRRLCDKFLEVAEYVLSWNFATISRLLRRLQDINQPIHVFRPPAKWKDLLSDPDFFKLFFKLHSRIRTDEELAVRSLNCLVQLASLSGDVLTGDDEFVAYYTSLYVSQFLETFTNGPLPHEMNRFCNLISRLFIHRPIQNIIRLNKDLRCHFFRYVYEYIIYLTPTALSAALGSCDHSGHEALVFLFDAWVLFLRGRWRNALDKEQCAEFENSYLKAPTIEIVNKFLASVQSPPVGIRALCADEEGNDDDTEDRILFKDLLNPLGMMVSYSPIEFLDSMVVLIRQRLNELQALVSGTSDINQMPVWQEDMHWIMLILAHTVVHEDLDGTCYVSEDVYELILEKCKERGRSYDEDTQCNFLTNCLRNPTADRPISDELDPFVKVLGELLVWSVLEHQLISDTDARKFMSPELARSTLLCLKRFVGGCYKFPDITIPTEVEGDHQNLADPGPYLPPFREVTKLVTEFGLNKVFTILSVYNAEEKLCRDAVEFLSVLLSNHQIVVESAPILFNQLQRIDIARLPSRGNLMRALVGIGVAANNLDIQRAMSEQILLPLRDRLVELAQQPSNSVIDSHIADIIQCFDGVALASESSSAETLAQFLHPLISDTCAPLMKSRAHNQTVVTAILQLMRDTATKVSLYLEEVEMMQPYETLLGCLETYRTEQFQRFAGIASGASKADDEDKAHDLVLFIEILANILSKNLLSGDGVTLHASTQVVLRAVEMLFTIMSEPLLQMPDVATNFYRLLLYLMEFSAEALAHIPPDCLMQIFRCIKMGMTSTLGSDILCNSMESLSAICVYLYENQRLITPDVHAFLTSMQPESFSLCLEYSSESNIFSEACSVLCCLIAIDRPSFNNFVNEILTSKNNEPSRVHIQEAFEKLFEEEPGVQRRKRNAFRQRMEKFLNSIQGLLTL